jgi:microsomal dipeptidase-like Zn-dependent dipeptidase
MHLDAISRAFDSGLRLLVASAVNSEMLADAYHGRPKNPGNDQNSDERNIRAQLAGMREMVKSNSKWMAIVTNPEEARRTIEDEGKLAIVLGIEVDSIAGQGMRLDDQLKPEGATEIVHRWWEEDVRLINPIHLTDNALGGTAVYSDRFNCLNDYLSRRFTQNGPAAFVKVDDAAKRSTTRDVRFLLAQKPGLLVRLYNLWYRLQYPDYMSERGRSGHVNVRGLSAAGRAFIRAMMGHGMFIDVEHMSSRALEDTLEIAEEERYPLVSSHTALRQLGLSREEWEPYKPGCRHEAMRSDEELKRIRDLGGVLGIGGHAGIIKGVKYDTDRSWAKAYSHAIDSIRGLGFKAVAIGTDMNGFAETPGARFRACNLAGGQPEKIDPKDGTRALQYGADKVPLSGTLLTKSRLGARQFDYNVDGLAHYGMLSDFTVDIELSLGRSKLDPFFDSAEAFVRAWEECVAYSRASKTGAGSGASSRASAPGAAATTSPSPPTLPSAPPVP